MKNAKCKLTEAGTTARPSEPWPPAVKPKRRFLLWAIITVVAAVAIGAAWFVTAANRLYRDAYAGWEAAEVIIDYMEAHDGRWPRSWDDLAGAKQRWLGIEEVQRRVDVDFEVDPQVLLQSATSGDTPPFRVVRLRNGSSAHWEGREPNEMILEHLKQQKRKAP